MDRLLGLGKILVNECVIAGGVPCTDIVKELPDDDNIQSFIGVSNFGIVDIVDT